MIIDVIELGNSKCICIPTEILKEYNIQDRVQLVLKKEGILIKPVKKVRNGWNQAFKDMRRNGDDRLLFDDIFEEE